MLLSSPVVNGHSHRFISAPYASPATAPYAVSRATSARPVARGRQPATKPTQPAASIWNGSHGPTPAVSRADVNSVTEPSTSPNPRPSARPASTRRKKTGSKPATPPPSGRSAAPTAASTPSTATDLASIPPSAISASTTASSSGSSRTNSHGASDRPTSAAPGWTNSGQVNAARPTALTTVSATAARAC